MVRRARFVALCIGGTLGALMVAALVIAPSRPSIVTIPVAATAPVPVTTQHAVAAPVTSPALYLDMVPAPIDTLTPNLTTRRLVELEHENNNLNARIRGLTAELYKTQSCVARVTQQLHDTTMAMREQEQQLASYKRMAAMHNIELTHLNDDCTRSTHELSLAHEKIATLQELLTQAQRHNTHIDSTASPLALENNANNNEAAQTIAQLQQEMAHLKEQVTEAQAHAHTLATTLANRGAISTEGLRELHMQHTKANQQLTAARTELKQAHEQYNVLTTQHHELQQAYAARPNVSLTAFEELKNALIHSQARYKKVEHELAQRPAISLGEFERITEQLATLAPQPTTASEPAPFAPHNATVSTSIETVEEVSTKL